MTLDKKAVVATALTLLDDVGYDGLTMRVLAKALNVQAPTLYWHFPSKQDLLDQMADALIAPVLAGVNRTAPPQEVLRALAKALRAALLSHRDGARVYAGTYVMGDNVFAVADAGLDALLRCGLDESAATDAMFNLIYYVLGFTIEEQGSRMRWSPADVEALRAQFAEVLSTRFSALTRCQDFIVADSFDTRFERGLDGFLSAIKACE
jgi:TetR/AcrR family transcriptional regulator, tetracycline repressor protein